MLLQRKSLAFVAPSGEKYLFFMLLKVRNFTWQKLSKFSETCFTTMKETTLALFNLAHPL